MTKYIIILFLLLQNLGGLAQPNMIVLPPPNSIPCVINKDHVKVSGKTLTSVGQTHTYTVDFFYPGEMKKPITWLVFGGQVVAQNTIPANGPIYVTVFWDGSTFDFQQVPDCIKTLPHLSSYTTLPHPPIGVVAITQGTAFQNSIYQADAIPVMQLVPRITCAQYPETQLVNYQQLPCLISGVDNCILPNSGLTHTYQWKSSVTPGVWNNIPGATQVDYQPLATTQNECYSRETQVFDPNNGLLTSFDNTGSCVNLYAFNAGQLYTDQQVVNFGEQPNIVDEMPYGGLCTSSGYQFFWWVSYNDKPWQLVGNSLHFPGITGGVNKESVRIKRSTICNGVELFTNILEFTYGDILSYQKENQNYIKENIILTKGIESWPESELLPTGKKIQNTMYYDGLARPMQKLVKEAGTPGTSGTWSDIVTPIVYDNFGRQTKSYLPYASANNIGQYKPLAVTEQQNYYQANYNESPSYAENILDDNPLNRVKQSKRPGTVWASSTGDQTEIDMNDPNEMVKIWNIGFLAFNVPGAIGNYQGNELFKHEYKDEKQNRVIEYTDKSGNLILRKVQIKANPSITHDGWLCTYNVYDKLNRLRFVIMPKVVEYMELNGWPTGIPSNMLIDLCERYLYDARGRLIEKRRPQAGTIRYVYDARDRLILTQDENQSLATAKKWSFVLYDELNREVVTGLFESAATRASLQASADALTLATAQVNVSLGAGHNENVNVFAPAHALGTNIQFNSIKYYDDYSYPGAKQFTTAHRIPVSTNPDVDAVAPGNRTLGLATGSKLRVLDNTNTVLVNTAYYDQNARIVQSHSENIKGGTDVMTNQYDYANKVLISSSKHTANNTLYSNFEVLTKHDFDILGRITFLRKNFSQTVLNYKNIAEYSYDELGRMKVKKLGPNPNSGGSQVESLEYSYNLNGQLTGINKFYALKDPSRYNKWDNFFGLYLGYDNRDNAFAKAELNGNITGAMWCTQGDDDQRKFDYEYDAANQLTKALFTQKDAGTGTWVNNKFNFSVGSNHASGDIQYDASGNILQMTQMGVLPNSTPFVMDDLRYTYAAGGYSNKLERVDDVSSNTNNGALRDFKDGANGTGSGFDYVYDYNGNLVLDKNKGIEQAGGNGVKYNFLDKVEEVVIAGKGTIKYVYDASGEKLQKIFTPLSGPVKTITYINEYVYDGNDLQFIHFEEGRVRVVDVVYSYPVKFLSGNVKLPGTDKMGVFDYFVRDHLGNTRMILTDELQSAEGLCTAELSVATIEEPQFGAIQPNGQPASNNELQVTRTSILPSWNWTANPITSSNGYCVGLKNIPGAAQNPAIGPNVILKVMAGDMINARADYFYQGNASAPTSNIFQPLFGSLLSSLQSSNVSTAVKGAGITQNGWGVTNLTSFVSNQPNYGNPAAPRAYLNVLFFDEQFNYVGCADPQRVTTNNMDYVQTQANLKCPKNGYAFVYLSNETENLFVYFDNFKVEHVRGRIVEESHYYPFGLKIAAISSNKLGDPENGHLQNRFGYQGIFAEEDEYTGWNEFDLRNYDPQIGRWTGVDPYDEFSSGYVGMGNNPANLTDPSGGNIFSDITLGGMVAIGATAGFIAGGIYDMIYNDGDLKYAFYGAMAGAAMFFITSSPLNVNIQYLPTVKQAIADAKKHKFPEYAYVAGFIRGWINEIMSLGKIVTIRGDGFVSNGSNIKGTLTKKTKRYFKRHPRAKRVANAYTEYHSGNMGDDANHGEDNFTDNIFKERFDENSVFLYGNCFQGRYPDRLANTSKNLNGATVIGSYNWQLDLPFLLFGQFSGNDILGSGSSHTVAPGTPLDADFLRHRIVQYNTQTNVVNVLWDGPTTTKINHSGRIEYKPLTEVETRAINDAYHKLKTKFAYIIFLLINGY